MNPLGRMGAKVIGWFQWSRHTAALIAHILWLAMWPRNWSRPTRNVLARQILFTGIEASRFVSLTAFLIGVAIVVQAQVWLNRFGQSALLGPLLVAIVIREVGPLLTNLIIIARSGAAITSELASMRVAGEIQVLEAQGIEPLTYLLMPRILGVALSVFSLSIVFIVVCFISGLGFGILLGANTGEPMMFFSSVASAIRPADVISLLAKTLIPGLLTAAICCEQGLRIAGALSEVPQAVTRGQVMSLAVVFVTSVLISAITFL